MSIKPPRDDRADFCRAFSDFLLDQDRKADLCRRTRYLPGSDEKIELMAKRLKAGYDPCQPDDRPMPLGYGWHIKVGKNGRVISKQLMKNQGIKQVIEEVQEPLQLAGTI